MKSLRNLPPLNLLSSGDKPTFRSPLIRCQDYTLQRLDRLEVILLADSITFIQDKLLHLLVVAQHRQVFVRVNTDDSRLDSVSEIDFVRDDDSDGLLGVG
jgi:hypothetical protein